MSKGKKEKPTNKSGGSKQKPTIKQRLLTWWFSNFPPLQ
jgi:hypothetical protein